MIVLPSHTVKHVDEPFQKVTRLDDLIYIFNPSNYHFRKMFFRETAAFGILDECINDVCHLWFILKKEKYVK